MKENLPSEQITSEDVNRMIAQFGKAPTEEVQRKVREELQRQKTKFQSLEHLRNQDHQRKTGRTR